jgi:hypothetical protein
MVESTSPKPRTAWARLLGSDEPATKHEERLAKIQEHESTERVRLQEQGLTDRAKIQCDLEVKRATVTSQATTRMALLDARKAFWCTTGWMVVIALGLCTLGSLLAVGLIYSEWLKHTRPLLSDTGCVEHVEMTTTHSTDARCGFGGTLEVTYLKDADRFQVICRCPKVVSVVAPDAGVEAGGP